MSKLFLSIYVSASGFLVGALASIVSIVIYLNVSY